MSFREDVIAQLRAEGLDVTEWHDDPGASYDEHTHPQREVRVVLSGSMTLIVDGMAHQLVAGDRFDLEEMQPHSAVVGPSGVSYIAGTVRDR